MGNFYITETDNLNSNMPTKKMFLIDDDEDDRLLFCEALADIAPQFTCYTAVSATAALNKLHGNDVDLPDLILLDVNMPTVNGWECLSILKSKATLKDIPVIMYSTSSSPDDIEKALRWGALCFFTKPYDFHDLKSSLALVVSHLMDDTLDALADSSPSFAGAARLRI